MYSFDGYSAEKMRAAKSLKWTAPEFLPASDLPVRGHWVAEMDYATAPVVLEVLQRAVSNNFFGYPPTWLKQDLAQATVDFQRKQFGWELPVEAVYAAPSVLDVFRAFLRLLPAGGRVLVPTPAYMPFLSIPKTFGLEVVQVPAVFTGEKWSLDFELLQTEAASASALVLCNPWNPTGRVLSISELEAVRDLAVSFDLLVFADEIHSPLTLPRAAHIPYASLPGTLDHTVTATAASKGFNLPGLHCAQGLVSPESALHSRWLQVSQFLGWAAPLGSLATVVAYAEGVEWLTQLRAYLRENLLMADGIIQESSGWQWQIPQGGYLGFLRFTGDLESGLLPEGGLSGLLFQRTGVATVPGAAMGEGWDSALRFNFASSRSVLADSLRMLTESV